MVHHSNDASMLMRSSSSLSIRRSYSFRADLIRFGKLVKLRSRNISSKWIVKIADVRYGEFSYWDEEPSIGDAKKRCLPLNPEISSCKAIRRRNLTDSDNLFQLSISGVKRIFACETSSDRDAWVRAIQNAMIFNAEDSAVIRMKRDASWSHSYSPFRIRKSIRRLKGDSRKSVVAPFPMSNGDTESVARLAEQAMLKSYSSMPGPAALFSDQVARFSSHQSLFASARTSDAYAKLVSYLCEVQLEDKVMGEEEYFNDGAVRASADSGPSIANNSGDEDATATACTAESNLSFEQLNEIHASQVLKDLQRDQVKINDEVFYGRNGGTAVIMASLMQLIMDKAALLNQLRTSTSDCLSPAASRFCLSTLMDVVQTSPASSCEADGAVGETVAPPASCADSPSGGSGRGFELSEAAAMACAREMLMLCNRTQSGGDSYFCVESLLAWCGQGRNRQRERLCVLTPLDAEAEPLEIRVDVVSRGALDSINGEGDTVLQDDDDGVSSLGDDENSEDEEKTVLCSPSSRRSSWGSTVVLKLEQVVKRRQGSSSSSLTRLAEEGAGAGVFDEVLSLQLPPSKGYGANSALTQSLHTASKPTILAVSTEVRKDGTERKRVKIFVDLGEDAPPAHAAEEKQGGERPLLASLLEIEGSGNREDVSDGWSTLLSRSAGLPVIDTSSPFSLRRGTAGKGSAFTLSDHLPQQLVHDDGGCHEIDRIRSVSVPQDSTDVNGDPFSDVPMTPSGKNFLSRLYAKGVTPLRERLRRGSDTITLKSKSMFYPFSAMSTAMRRKKVDAGALLRRSSTVDIDALSKQLFSQHNSQELQVPSMQEGGNNNSNSSGRGDADKYCIRVFVSAKSKYRVCCADPQGDASDVWARLSAEFSQCFYIKSNCDGHPEVTERTVNIKFDAPQVDR